MQFQVSSFKQEKAPIFHKLVLFLFKKKLQVAFIYPSFSDAAYGPKVFCVYVFSFFSFVF